MQATTILLRNAEAVLTRPGEVMRGPINVLIEAGRITAIGTALMVPEGAEIIDASERLVAPGLVNAHWHSPMQLSHGTSDMTNHKVFMWENQVDTANRSRRDLCKRRPRLPADAEVGHDGRH
jgi:imidazolonepropionase-like amidohydrolase